MPEAVTDLAAEQAGNAVVLRFTLPQQTVNHRPLDGPPTVEIYREVRSAARAASAAPPALRVTIPPAMAAQYGDQRHITYSDSLGPEDFAPQGGSHVEYTVRTRTSAKRESADSNLASLDVYPAAEAVTDLSAQVSQSAVTLTWTPSQKTPGGQPPHLTGYRLYRATAELAAHPGEAPSLARIAEPDVASSSFADTNFEFGKTYVYVLRSVVQTPNGPLESADSNTLTVTPKDTFPPAAPLGLEVVFVPAQGDMPAHLELSWAISPENDVAGYSIYRSEQVGVLGTRLNAGPLPTPAFRDMNVQPGHRYTYSVTAVDRSGNESPASAPVAGDVPAEN